MDALTRSNDVLNTSGAPINQCVAQVTPANASLVDPCTLASEQAGICLGSAAQPTASTAGERIVRQFIQLGDVPDKFTHDIEAFVAALPRDPMQMLAFERGLEGGFALGLVDVVANLLKSIAGAANLLATYQAIMTDPSIWWAVAQDIVGGTPGSHLTDEIKQDYPDLYTVISSINNLAAAINSVCEYLGRPETSDNGVTSEVLETAAALTDNAPIAIGYALTDPVIQDVIRAQGDPTAQGIAIGRFLGPVLVNLLLLAFGLFAAIEGAAVTAAGAAEVTEDALVILRTGLSADEMTGLVQAATTIEPGLPAAAEAVSHVDQAAISAYESLAYRVDAYKQLVKSTLSFNQKIRHLYGLAVRDVSYVSMRLDAHHVIEAAWWDRFSAFQKLWPTSDDMPAIALHTEWHIRSGVRMAEDLELFGAENEPSLTTAIQKAFQNPDGTLKSFSTPGQLLDAYEAFYAKYSSRLWAKIQPVFATVRAQLSEL